MKYREVARKLPTGRPRFQPRSGDESFHVGGVSIGATLLDYWRWSGSELLSNVQRGVLAEFLIARTLDVTHEPRVEWAPWDLRTRSGVTVEVKSAAYWQAWPQRRPSDITFDIAPRKQVWDVATNETTTLPEPRRLADVYVFCVLGRRTCPRNTDPLDVDQWAFYVLGGAFLDRERPAQKTIGIDPLRSLAAEAPYGGLSAAIEAAASGRRRLPTGHCRSPALSRGARAAGRRRCRSRGAGRSHRFGAEGDGPPDCRSVFAAEVGAGATAPAGRSHRFAPDGAASGCVAGRSAAEAAAASGLVPFLRRRSLRSVRWPGGAPPARRPGRIAIARSSVFLPPAVPSAPGRGLTAPLSSGVCAAVPGTTNPGTCAPQIGTETTRNRNKITVSRCPHARLPEPAASRGRACERASRAVMTKPGRRPSCPAFRLGRGGAHSTRVSFSRQTRRWRPVRCSATIPPVEYLTGGAPPCTDATNRGPQQEPLVGIRKIVLAAGIRRRRYRGSGDRTER